MLALLAVVNGEQGPVAVPPPPTTHGAAPHPPQGPHPPRNGPHPHGPPRNGPHPHGPPQNGPHTHGPPRNGPGPQNGPGPHPHGPPQNGPHPNGPGPHTNGPPHGGPNHGPNGAPQEPDSPQELEEDLEEEHDVPVCLSDCACYPNFEECEHFDIASGDEVCWFIHEKIYDTQCSMDCDDQIQGFIAYIAEQACMGEWPMPGMEEHEEENQGPDHGPEGPHPQGPPQEPHSPQELEEDIEEDHDIPLCLSDCTCYPHFHACEHFDMMKGEEVCAFIENDIYATQCSEDCPMEVQGFISYIKEESCSGNWPMEGMEDPESPEELEEDIEEGHDVPICLSDCTCYPNFEACEHFDVMKGEEVCAFIENDIYQSGCSHDCDHEVQTFIGYIHHEACNGSWPMPGMEEEEHEEEVYEATVEPEQYDEASYEPAYEEAGTYDEASYEPAYEQYDEASYEPAYEQYDEASYEPAAYQATVEPAAAAPQYHH